MNLVEVSLDEVVIDDHLKQRRVGQRTVDDLVEAYRAVGFVGAIIVYERGGKYHLVAGLRRVLAARKARMKAVPAIVVPEAKAAEVARFENAARRSLPPPADREEAAALADRIIESLEKPPPALKKVKQPGLFDDELLPAELAMLATLLENDLDFGAYDEAPEGVFAWRALAEKLRRKAGKT